MAVLLEEAPLQHLGALVGVVRQIGGAVGEVPEDRVRLRERAAVVKDERRHPESGIELPDHLRPVRAVDDAHLLPLVLDAEMREQQPDLVAVAADLTVVEEHRDAELYGPRPDGVLSAPSL